MVVCRLVFHMKLLRVFCLSVGFSSIPFGHAQDQRISIDISSLMFSPEDSGQLSILYESDDGQLATGIGLTVHFDSSQVHVDEIINLFHQSKVGIQILDDEDDIDQNPKTDTYITAAWASMDGGWPDTVLQPVKLFDLNITTTSEFEASGISVRITSSDVNFNGVGDSITLSNGIINDEPNRQLLFKQLDRE